MVYHRRCEHQDPQDEDIDNICYGTLKPHQRRGHLQAAARPEAEGREKQRSKESSRSQDHGRPSQRGKHSTQTEAGPESASQGALVQ